MHDAVLVGVVDGGGDGTEDLEKPPGVHSLRRDELGQRAPPHVLHHDQDPIPAGKRVEYRHQVGVNQGGAEPGLTAKPSNVRLRALGVEALDCDVAAQDAVLSQEHRRRPSRAQAAVDAEAIGEHDPWLDLGRYRHLWLITLAGVPKTVATSSIGTWSTATAGEPKNGSQSAKPKAAIPQRGGREKAR